MLTPITEQRLKEIMGFLKPGPGEPSAFDLLFEERERAQAGGSVTAVLPRARTRRYVLDANALIGFFEARQGVAGKVRTLLGEAKLLEMPITVIAADQERASRAVALKQRHTLSYADAFAAELAMEQGAWLVTADPKFQKVGKALSVYPISRYDR